MTLKLQVFTYDWSGTNRNNDNLREEALYQRCHKLLNSGESYQSSYDRIEALRLKSQRNAEIAISLL